MTIDEAIIALQKIIWEGMSLDEAKTAAIEFMALWDWQEKVPAYTRGVHEKTSVLAIASFMWNATMKGLEIKQRKVIGELID